MATISSVSVDFIANVANFVAGLESMNKKTKSWSAGLKSDIFNSLASFEIAKRSVDAVTQAIVKGTEAVAKNIDAIDTLAKSAAKFQVGTDFLQSLQYTASKLNISFESVTTALVKTQNATNEAISGQKEYVATFKELNISIETFAALNLQDKFTVLIDKLSQIKDGNRQAAISAQFFGKGYADLLPIIRGGTDELNKFREAALKKGLIISEEDIAKVASAKDAIEGMQEAVQGVVNTITVSLSPAIEEISKRILAAFENTNSLKEGFKSVIIVVGALVTTASVFINLLRTITGVVQFVVGGIGVLAQDFVQVFVNAFLKIEKAALEMYVRLVDKAPSFLFSEKTKQNLVKNAQSTIVEINAKISEGLAKVDRGILVSGKENILAGLSGELTDELRKIQQALLDSVDTISGIGKASKDAVKTPFKDAKLTLEETAYAIRAVKSELFGLGTLLGTKPKGFTFVEDLNKQMITISDATRFAQETQRREMFGAGTFVSSTKPMGFGQGIGLPKGITLPTIDINNDEKKRIEDLGKALTEQGRSATEVYNQRVKDIEAASIATDQYGRAVLSAEGKTKALSEATKEFAQSQADAFGKGTIYWEKAVSLTQNFADGLANAIVAGQNFGDALKNVFQDVLKQIAVLIIRTTILQAIMAAVGLASAPAALAFGQMTGIVGKAAGGPVTGGVPYRVGEAGPETFIPTQNGIILPNNMRGGGGVVVNQVINVQTGVAQTVRAEMMQLLPSFKQQAIAGVLESKQRGGSYSRGLAAA
jgi:hypothetical protein